MALRPYLDRALDRGDDDEHVEAEPPRQQSEPLHTRTVPERVISNLLLEDEFRIRLRDERESHSRPTTPPVPVLTVRVAGSTGVTALPRDVIVMTHTDHHNSNDRTIAVAPSPSPAVERSSVTIPQYSRRAIFAIWAAAALPMAALAWIVAPYMASSSHASNPLVRALLVCLTAGLVWQFVLVVALVWFEQRSLRWTTLRDALWLRAPRNPKTGKRGGKMRWMVLPLVVALAAEEFIPTFAQPANRDFGTFIGSTAGHAFMHGAWGWFALILVMMTFNTVLGEELLFRGFLLPRMNGAFGDRDWVANGVLFAGYHMHEPWVIIPSVIVDTFVLAGASKRYRSAWVGIAVHSAQSVFFAVLLLALVVK
jgi:membrane protease YdiL (CAAX protease family)